MARKKIGYSDDTRHEFMVKWLIPKLRRISLIWPAKSKARKAAEVKVKVGTFQNGRPIMKTKWKCVRCEGLFDKPDTQMDHRIPAIKVSEGFKDWNTYLDRLLSPQTNYDCLCKPCHSNKTTGENVMRRHHRNIKKTSKKVKKRKK